MKAWQSLRVCGSLAVISLILNACASALAGDAAIWIDAPRDGLTFEAVQPIAVEGHASSRGGVSRVEVWVDGALIETISELAPKGEFVSYHTTWSPSGTGTYTIQTVAYSIDGVASAPDSARVTFGGIATVPITPPPEAGCPTPVGGGPTPVSCEPDSSGCPTPIGGGPTPVSCEPESSGCPTPPGGGPTPVSCEPVSGGCPTPVGGGPTPVSCEAPVVNFWADPPEISAGACTDIRWHVENVQSIVFGGINQPFDGSYEACLCANERYSLLVNYLDGTQDKPYVTVTVSGSCETEAPGDSEPPPAPVLVVPANGLVIGCKGSQTLAWLPAEDPSGIAKYHVQVQRHSGNNQWKTVEDLAAAGKSVNVSVECGWYYRWRVSAIDGAGNTGAWSDWSEFTINLE